MHARTLWVVVGLLASSSGCSLVLDPSDLMRGDGGAGDGGGRDGAVLDGGLPGDGGTPGDGSASDGGEASAPARAVAAGRDHTCAIREPDGHVFCWGENAQLQAGDAVARMLDAPHEVENVEGAVQIGAGDAHSCALLSTGSISCWGFNDMADNHDRLGSNDGALDMTALPVTVTTVSAAIELAVGFWHSCAALSDGSVRCWGQNASGELGTGCAAAGGCTQIGGSAAAEGVNDAHMVAAGSGSSCAVFGASNELACWGFNEGMQLGFPDPTPVAPMPVLAVPAGIDRVAAGGGDVFSGAGLPYRGHLCVTAMGLLTCWGANDAQQVGPGADIITNPTAVSIFDDVADLSLGYRHTCVIYDTSRDVACWGDGGDGRLGVLSSERPPVRDPVPLDGPALSIAAGNRHTCALLESGDLYCWGANDRGQLGVPAAPGGAVPVRVVLPAASR